MNKDRNDKRSRASTDEDDTEEKKPATSKRPTSSPETSPGDDSNEETESTATTTSSSTPLYTPKPKMNRWRVTYEQKLDFKEDSRKTVPLQRVTKTNKLLWTPELHQMFLHAIRKLGVNGTYHVHISPPCISVRSRQIQSSYARSVVTCSFLTLLLFFVFFPQQLQRKLGTL